MESYREDYIQKAESFLEERFKENPGFSFGDWEIMYDHSILVKNYSIKISEEISRDDYSKTVLVLGALLHDIGKTYQADEEKLRNKHDELAYEVSRDFLKNLEMEDSQENKLNSLLKGKSDFLEAQIIEDADIVAFFADKKLMKAFKEWALSKDMPEECERKLNKIEQLKFEPSKQLALEYYKEATEILEI